MNYITIAILALTVLPVVFGLLLGFGRGSRYSVVRLIVVALCLIAALLLRQPVTKWVMGLNVGGQSLEQSIVASLPEELASLGDTAVLFVELLLSALVFVALFALLRLLTALILGPILKAICRKKRNNGALGGGFIGLVQGVIVALVICIPLSGVLTEVNDLTQNEAFKQMQNTTAYVSTTDRYADSDVDLVGETTTDGNETTEDGGNGNEQGGSGSTTEIDFVALLDGYANSAIGKMYSAVGSKPFEMVSYMTVDGKKYTLSGQMDAITGGIEMAYELQKLSDLGDDLMNSANLESVTEVFDKLDKVWSNLPDEAKETIGNVLDVVAKENDLPVDLSQIDFANISFKKEGEVFTALQAETSNIADKEEVTLDDLKTIIQTCSDSDVILPLLASTTGENDNTFNLSEETKTQVKDFIQTLEVSNEKKEMLEKFCGVSAQ